MTRQPETSERFKDMTDYLLIENMASAVQSIRAKVSKSYVQGVAVAHKLNEDERETLEQAYTLTVEAMTMLLDRKEAERA